MFLKGIIIAIVCIILDQWSKEVVFNFLFTQPFQYYEVTSFFNLVVVRNYGISFGMFDNLENSHYILSSIAICVVIVLLFWLKKAQNMYMTTAISLIIGGAIGNVIDRFRFGAVSDFLDFHYMGYHWPAFNVADSAVFIGVALILLENFFCKDKETPNAK